MTVVLSAPLEITWMQVVNVNDPDRRTGSKDNNMFSYYVDVIAIHNQDRENNANDEEADEASVTQSKGLVTFNLNDYYAIQVLFFFFFCCTLIVI